MAPSPRQYGAGPCVTIAPQLSRRSGTAWQRRPGEETDTAHLADEEKPRPAADPALDRPAEITVKKTLS